MWEAGKRNKLGGVRMKDNSKTAKDIVTLEVLNPRGVIPPAPIFGLTNPRVTDLAGKRIALLSEKQEAVHFFDALEELLHKKYPTATILRLPSAANPALPDNTEEIAKQCDTWLQGVKTSGSSEVDYEVKMEKRGKPGATFTVDSLLNQRKRLAEVNGMPTLRIIPIPSYDFLAAEGYPEKMKPVAASVFEATIRALTSPLTHAEKNPKPPVRDYQPLKFTGSTYAEAYEKLQQYFVDNQMSDGLPVTPPTAETVKWMLSGTSRSPDEEIGVMAPRNGMATIEKIAINAVMAGAKPEYLPVIIAAIECLADKRFNLYHLQTSTASPVPLIWVNGPIAREIGMNYGMGYLGHGFRANSTIGRAVSMCLINIGWRLVDADSGLTGEPEGYCNFIFAENEPASPWESFAVEHGFKPEDSTVTVIENFYYNRFGPGGGMSSQTMEKSLDILAEMVSNTGTSPKETRITFFKSKYCEIALHPTFAKQLAAAGFTKQSLVQWLYDHTRVPWNRLSQDDQEFIKAAAATGIVPGLKETDCQPGGTVPSFSDPNHIAILVAGDAAGYTVVWGTPVGSTVIMGGNQSAPSIPFMTKLIRGATLVK
jgi:hypothetical protein